jgi:trigger factor
MVITVTKSEALPYYEKAYRDLQPELHLKGFRKGKAPIHLIKQYFGKEVEEDASSDMFNDIFFKVIKEERIQVVGEPEIVSKRITGMKLQGRFDMSIYHHLNCQNTRD